MEDIMNYTPRREEDFYSILGCSENATTEQIQAEYKCLARHCHPDKHPDDPQAGTEFALLQQAKCVLTDPKQRADYDKWRLSGLAMGYNEWKARRESMHVMEMEQRLSALLQLYPHSRLNTWLQWIGQLQLPDETRNIEVLAFHLSLHWAQKVQREPMLLDRPSNRDMDCCDGSFVWQRQPASETLRRFRNYEI